MRPACNTRSTRNTSNTRYHYLPPGGRTGRASPGLSMEKTTIMKNAHNGRKGKPLKAARAAALQGKGKQTRPLLAAIILIMLAITTPSSVAQENAAGGDVPSKSEQEENWLLAQIRRFRSYPHLHHAYKLLAQSRLDEAADEIKAYLRIAPEDSNVRISYLDVLYRLNKADELLRQAEQALAQAPANPKALLYRSLASQMKGDFGMALASLRPVYQSESASQDDRIFAANMAADIGMSKGNPLEALTALTALSAFQDSYSAHYRRGAVLAALDRLDEAERAYHAALERARETPESIQAQSALGYLAQRRGNDAKLIAHGEAILALEPMNIEWLRTLANAYYNRGNYQRAEHMARRALATGNALQDRVYLANILSASGNHAAAIEEHSKIAQESKDRQLTYRAYMGLGYAYQATGRQDAAHDAFEQAARIIPTREAPAAAASTRTPPASDPGAAAARKDLAGLLSEYKKHPDAGKAASIGYLYAQKNDHEKAASYLELALKMKKHAEWRLQLAEEYAELGDRQKAVHALAAYAPKTDLDWRRVGAVHLKIGDKEQALAALSMAAGTAETRLQLGRLHVDMQRFDQALAELQAVLEERTHTDLQIQALRQIAYIRLRQEKHEQALAAFQAAVDKGDTGLATRKELGFLFARLEKYPQALEQFLHVLESERSARNMLTVARMYAAMKQPEAALQYYRMAEAGSRELNAGELTALHAESGFAYAEEGRFEEARQHWEKSAGTNDTPDMQMNLAYAEEMRGMLKEALARLDRIAHASLDKDRKLHLLDQYARLHEKSANTAEAERYLEQATALSPSPERHYRMALYAIESGKNERARAHLEEAVRFAPQNNDYLRQLAYVCKAQGDHACAIGLFEQVVSRDPKRTSLYQELAYACMRAGDNEKAIAWFKKAIDNKIEAKAIASSLRTYLVEPERPETVAQNAAGDDQQIHAMRRQVREMTRRYQLNAYQSYRANTREPTGGVTPGFVTGGLVPSQGGIEFLYQPPGIGYRDGRTFRVFGRTLWSNEPESLRIDSPTLQGGAGIEYKPFRDVNAYISLERLIKIGSRSENNWLARVRWGYSDGYDMKPNLASWNQTILYVDAGYFLQRDKIRSVYAELRQGRAYNVNNAVMLTPHVMLAGRGQRPDPSDASYLEVGAGISVKYLFNETRYEAARSSVELIAQYRKPLEDRRSGGWMLTAALQF